MITTNFNLHGNQSPKLVYLLDIIIIRKIVLYQYLEVTTLKIQ